MNTFALIKIWELEKAAPVTKEFLDLLCNHGYGKREEKYYIFDINTPNINDGTLASKGFNICKNALLNHNKYKRNDNDRYFAMMFTT